MTRKTLVSILILTLCTILLISPETAETREPATGHNGAEHSFHAADYVQHGREHIEAGDYAAAIADFDKALQIAPEDPATYYYRASAKFEWGKSEQATGNMEQAKRLYHAAIEDYTQVITLDPENPRAYIFGGMVHLRLAGLEADVGNRKQAKHHYQLAIEDASQSTLMASTMEYALFFSLSVNAAYLKLADAEVALGKTEDAHSHYQQVVTIKADHALAYYAQGLAKQALGQHDAAEFDFAKARVLNPYVDKLYPFSSGGEE